MPPAKGSRVFLQQYLQADMLVRECCRSLSALARVLRALGVIIPGGSADYELTLLLGPMSRAVILFSRYHDARSQSTAGYLSAYLAPQEGIWVWPFFTAYFPGPHRLGFLTNDNR